MRKILQDFLSHLPRMGWGLRLVWGAARGWTVAWVGLLALQGLVPVGQVLLIRGAINRLAATPELRTVLLPVLFIGLLWLVGQGLSALLGWVRAAQAELVQDRVHELIHEKALSLDLAFFDQPESYDLLHRAQVDALSQPLALLESLGVLVQNGLTVLVLAGVLATYALWLPCLLVGSALPGLWTMARQILREHHWRLAHTVMERRARYYDWMITEQASAAELRLFDLGPFHRAAFKRLREQLRNGRLGLAKAAVKADLSAGLVAWTGSMTGLGWMLQRILAGQARLGDLVLCYTAFQQGQTLLRTLLESTGKVYRSLLFLENLFEFLELKTGLPGSDAAAAPPFPLKEGIQFEGVTFTYPGSEHPALADFNLQVQAGRVTAIVGHNGAGKSTLIKLLCRFYDPQGGRVLVDGQDLRDLDLAAFHRQLAVLFQEPVRYHASAAENIAFGDVAALGDDSRIRQAAQAAGAEDTLLRLPDGFETVLGKWFGGAELSSGEWQRVALARAFFRQAALVVLDEPTSAMDSWAEHDWLSRFRTLTEGRTALMITHRFTTAMHADIIHVMVEGRIIESGTHASLVQAKGHYAESWAAQMEEMSHS